MPNESLQPIIDIYPWPNGLEFRTAEDWWYYVREQGEENKLDLLMTMALLSDKVCQLLLAHDQALFDRFQLSPQTTDRIRTIHADSLTVFAMVLVEQRLVTFKEGKTP